MKNRSFKRGFMSGFAVAAMLFIVLALSNTCFGQQTEKYEITTGYFNGHQLSGEVELSWNDSTVNVSQDETFEYEYLITYIEETCGTMVFHTKHSDIEIIIVYSLDMLMFKLKKKNYNLWFEAVGWDTYVKTLSNE